jgi:hypothetical protein
MLQYWGNSYGFAGAVNLNTLLLLHGDGSNGSRSIADSSFLNLSLTPVGETQISTAQVKSGFGQSIWVPDSSSQLITTSLPSQYNFGTNDFTFEYFVYPTHPAQTYARYLTLAGGIYPDANYREVTFRQRIYTYNYELFFLAGANVVQTSSSSIGVIRNAWQHHAVVKNGTTLTAYVNGISCITQSNVTTAFNFSTFCLSPTFESADGYYDEVRISNSAIYTANFTPPSAPFSS